MKKTKKEQTHTDLRINTNFIEHYPFEAFGIAGKSMRGF